MSLPEGIGWSCLILSCGDWIFNGKIDGFRAGILGDLADTSMLGFNDINGKKSPSKVTISPLSNGHRCEYTGDQFLGKLQQVLDWEEVLFAMILCI